LDGSLAKFDDFFENPKNKLDGDESEVEVIMENGI